MTVARSQPLALRHPGLARAAESVDEGLSDIRRLIAGSRFPRRDELLLLFSLSSSDNPFSFVSALEAYLDTGRGDVGLGVGELAPYALGLGVLEDTLIDIYDALKWAEEKSSFQWWVNRRLKELGDDTLIVISAPGSTRTFEVQRDSSLAAALEELNKKVNLPQEVLTRAAAFRILTVPHRDGADALWHPISLGHELAHLRFTGEWVDKLLGGLPEEQDPSMSSYTQIVRLAREWTSGQLISAPHWYIEVRDWLRETACDTALWHYYDQAGVEALKSYLDLHTPPGASPTHPPPVVRLWVLENAGLPPGFADIIKQSNNPIERARWEAYRDLAPLVRQEVCNQLAGVALGTESRLSVRTKAVACRRAGEPPSSTDWAHEAILEEPASIECGLVASIWSRQADEHDDPAEVTPDEVRTRQEARVREEESWRRRVQHAVDFLQFKHRFSAKLRERADLDVSKDDFSLTNTLRVSSDGVRTGASQGEGRPTRDVRLGRHFIVFKRNAAVSLTPTGGAVSGRVQEMVEVGWGEKFVLHPHEMVLAVTLESILMDADCNAQVLSRSSMGRMGLLSATAVHVQPGFRGCLTLELVNLASIPLEIIPGQRIAQIVALPICGSHHPYEGKYQDQDWLPRFSEASRDGELEVIGSLKERA